MSKKAKSAASMKRRAEKRGRKNAMRAMYAKWTEDGLNNKKGRSHERSKDRTVSNFKHEVANCGNVGCAQCFPDMPQHVEARRIRALRENARLSKA